MWDWDLEDWFEFGRKQNEELERWRNLGKTEEQLRKERENRARMEQEKKAPPQTYDNGFSTILYVLVMLAGTIFYDRVLIWIAATIIYCYYKFVPYNKRK